MELGDDRRVRVPCLCDLGLAQGVVKTNLCWQEGGDDVDGGSTHTLSLSLSLSLGVYASCVSTYPRLRRKESEGAISHEVDEILGVSCMYVCMYTNPVS